MLPKEFKVCEVGNYSFYHHNESVVIFDKGEGNIEVSASEVERLTRLLDRIGGLISFKSLPPFVKEKPFEISFTEEGKCILIRDKEKVGLSFAMEEVDNLIKGLRDTLQKLVDVRSIKGNRGPGIYIDLPEPPLEGR